MQDNAMSKWLSPLMAFCLSFLIIATLAPITGIQIDRQLDFWMLWLATMLILALPVCYLEIALAKRSKTTALQALSSLTREADSSQRWRIVGWLAVVFIPFLAGAMLNHASNVIAVANLRCSAASDFCGAGNCCICIIAGATFNSGWDYCDRRTCIFDYGECDGN
jgi:Na+-dependent transporters of the SNF family